MSTEVADTDMESEIELTSVTHQGQKAAACDFELLKVLGQGSFGKVCYSVIEFMYKSECHDLWLESKISS